MAVSLALDLILKHAVGLRQLANDDEHLAPISDLAELWLKGNLLAENELVCWHIHLRLAQLRNPHPIDAPLDHHLGMLAVPDLAAEDASATPPDNRHARAPCRGYLGGAGRSHVALVALTGLARLASG
jgi:hypothetical protein